MLHQVVGYDDRIELLYAAADLLVGRGGASTVAEVAVTGTPAILVPWSGAAEDHQTLNVRWLADQGGAVLLPEARARPARRPSSTSSGPTRRRSPRSARGGRAPASCTAAARSPTSSSGVAEPDGAAATAATSRSAAGRTS